MASKPQPVEKLLNEAQTHEPSKTLPEALVKAQKMMRHAHLDGVNPHFKSKYSTLQAVIDAVKPSLNECGIAFLQRAHWAEGGVSVETIFIHESGEELSGGAVFVPVDKVNAHGTGSAYTYAKRYGLAMACGIGADEDDDGNTAAENPPKKGEPVHGKNGDFKGNSTGRAPQSVAKTVLEEMGTEIPPVVQEAADAIGVALKMEDGPGAKELWDELENDEKAMCWGLLSKQEQKDYKRLTSE